MSIVVSCPCGKQTRVKDELAGKKIRCPACQGILLVPSTAQNGGGGAGIATAQTAQEERETQSAGNRHERDDPEPERRGRRRTPTRSSRTALWVIMASLAAVLIIGGGVAVWLLLQGRDAGKTADDFSFIIGTWYIDADASKALPENAQAKVSFVPEKNAYEFHADGTGRIFESYLDTTTDVTWKVVSKQGQSVDVEIRAESGEKALPISFSPHGKDQLRMKFFFVAVLKRGPALPPTPNYLDENAIFVKPRTQLNMGLSSNEKDKRDLQVADLFLSADGKRLAVSNNIIEFKNRKFQVWDAADEPKKILQIEGALLALSPNGKRLVCRRPYTEILDVDGNKVLGKVEGEQVFFRSSDTVVTVTTVGHAMGGTAELRIEQYDAANAKKINSFKANPGAKIANHALYKYVLPFQAEKLIAVLIEDTDQFKVWDLDTEQMVRDVSLSVDKKLKTNWFDSTTISPSGKWIGTSVRNGIGKPTIFDASTGAMVATIPRGISFTSYRKCFFGNRPTWLATSNIGKKEKSSKEQQIVAFDFVKQKVVAVFRGQDKPISQVAVSAEGRVLAAGDDGGNVLIWDLTEMK